MASAILKGCELAQGTFPDDFADPAPGRRVFPRQTSLLALLVLAALVPRAWMAWKVDILTEDGPIYIYAAMQMERGNLEAAFRDGNLGLNLYPVVLRGLHALGLPWELSGRLWGTLVATLVVLPMFGWVRRQFNDQVAAIACLIYAVHPGLIERSPDLLRCPTFWLLLMATIYFLWRAVTEVRPTLFLLAGMCFTLGVHFRVETWFLLVPWTLWSLFRAKFLSVQRPRLLAGAAWGLAVLPAFGLLLNLTWLRDLPRWEWCITQRASVVKQLLAEERSVPQSAATSTSQPAAMAAKDNLPAAAIEFAAAGESLRSQRSVMGFVLPFIQKMVDALELLFAIPLLLGLWTGRTLLKRPDRWTMVVYCGVSLAAVAAFWYLVHDIQGRYFYPIVLVSTGYAALGVFRLAELLHAAAERCVGALNPRLAWSTLALLATIAGIGCGDAFSTRFTDRVARRDLGQWIRTALGEGQSILGSEPRGWTVAWYAQSRYYGPPPQEIGSAGFHQQMSHAAPSVVVVSSRSGKAEDCAWYQQLCADHEFISQYRAVPNACLPASAHRTFVLVRDDVWPQVVGQPAQQIMR